MTHQEFEERLDEILDQLYQRGYESGLERTGLTLEQRIAEAKQAIRELLMEVVGADDIADLAVAAKILHPVRKAAYRRGIEIRNTMRQQLRTTITGKEGGE